MAVQKKLLQIFENNKGRPISGEAIARDLGCSRASVWKAVKSLRAEGYLIDSVTNRGYTFYENDILSAEGAAAYLQGDWKISVVESTDSTNEEVRRRAQAGAPDRTVVVAERQTGGKGRRGKSFYSPRGTGLYMSVLLRPKMNLMDATMVTCRVAVAVARAIDRRAGGSAQIKWVNDIYINGKKVCGILSEATSDLESGAVEFIVVGIGVNTSTRGFPEELKAVAGALPGSVNRNALLAEILNQLDGTLAGDIMKEYKDRSCVIGKEIEIIRRDGRERATAVDIDGEGRLIVRDESGNLKVLHSGEISIRI
jgi:BirA family biotin operon repressor/biotin-[acetyl-CoA-carboxylase] ligase